ncbi:MAG TPA: M13 family metallopeptidase [Steroidobacteraceae bacterium]|nr:M13 family metallopeptidase [Steroidobacteraceae bacterium]
MHRVRLFTTLVATALAAAVLPPAQAQTQTSKQPVAHGIAVHNMDPSISPGNDFFLYSNGAWVARTKIPADRPSLSVFSTLLDESRRNVAAIVTAAARSKAPAGSNERKVADLYASYMNAKTVDSLGLKPLQPELSRVKAIRSKRELAAVMGSMLRADVDPLNNTNFHTMHLFGLWTSPGFRSSAGYAVYLLQGGLVLPSTDYYLSDSGQMQQIRRKYAAHITAMLRLAGYTDPAPRATKILALEQAIAKVQESLADSEVVEKANNVWTLADFEAEAPGLDWNAYFAAAGLAHQREFYVWQPSAFAGESALVAAAPLATWKDWLAFHLLEEYGPYLSQPFEEETFDFEGKVLTGVSQQPPRWKRAVDLVNACLGDAVGQLYAAKYFPPQAKAEAQDIVAHLIAAYHKRLEALTWLAPSTKAEALKKLDSLYVGVGYPESWKDYSAYVVKPDDLFGNVRRAELWKYRYNIDRIGRPVDRHEWWMEPQTVNAVNLPLQDALSFPAAILQPPFFDPKAPAADNYGAIGTIIGHEISHTFDAEGSAFDAQGRLRNWWTAADHQRFEQEAKALEDQYDSYQALPGLHVNGPQTIDEDIADLGGVMAAQEAYHDSLNGRAAPKIDGFSGDQQFFIACGQNWASKVRPAALRRQVLTDPHAPAKFRVDTVRNSDAWYEAFDVTQGQTLYLTPDRRVHIW